MSSKKEKEVLTSIINMYKARPFLWNKSHKDYHNKDARAEGFKVILDAFKTLDESIDMKTAKRKIENMRTTYTKELKKVLASKQESDGDGTGYVPNLWYFNALSFLNDSTDSCRRLKESFSAGDTTDSGRRLASFSVPDHQSSDPLSVENENSSSDEENKTTTTLSISPKRKKGETLIDKQGNALGTVEKLVAKLSDKDQQWEVYGSAIGYQLRDVNEDQLVICQKLISDAIFYAKLNKLTEYSQIVTLNR